MRRYLALGLLAVLTGQASGAALASNFGAHDGGARFQSPTLRVLAAIESGIQNSRILAQLTGSENRYTLAHMVMPHLVQNGRLRRAQPPNMDTSRLVPRVVVPGVASLVRVPSRPPRHRTRDPLAIEAARALRQGATTSNIPSVAKRPPGGTPSLRMPSPSSARIPSPTLAHAPVATQPFSLNRGIPQVPSPQMLASTDAGAGLAPYWTYQQRTIPGLGVAMVNIGTGNLVVQSTDLDIHERGLDLIFQRTYNSQSLHDINGDDGSEASVFGNAWTNGTDAHLVFRYAGQTISAISVYSGDGTRCDYTPATDGSGDWVPCTGQYATLEVDPNNPCSYWWVQKNGTADWFHTDSPGSGCNFAQANLGRLYAVYGRNSNNSITFNYSFSGQQKWTSQITQIVVNHSDGQSYTMNFAKFAGNNELSTITYPMPGHSSQATIRYNYDSVGDLLEVDKPGNDAAPNLSAEGVPAGDLPQTYGYTQPVQFLHACGPRATISLWQNGPNPANDGACISFDFDSSVRLTDWAVKGILNPQIGDQGYLQPSLPTAWNQYYIGYFVYGEPNNPPCTGTKSTTITLCDSDGHSTIWTIDSTFKITRTQIATGKSSPSNLVTTQTWDAYNNLVASTDPRGNETDYAYDVSGNLTAFALPAPGTTDVLGKGASFRATTLYSYDPATNNILAACDPSYTDALGKDWGGDPGKSDSLCPQTIGSRTSQGATVFQYNTTDPAEPYGRLIETYTPMGYDTSIKYLNSPQGGDFGLPTQTIGAIITQNWS
jgi:YD repeat-containing protein